MWLRKSLGKPLTCGAQHIRDASWPRLTICKRGSSAGRRSTSHNAVGSSQTDLRGERRSNSSGPALRVPHPCSACNSSICRDNAKPRQCSGEPTPHGKRSSYECGQSSSGECSQDSCDSVSYTSCCNAGPKHKHRSTFKGASCCCPRSRSNYSHSILSI